MNFKLTPGRVLAAVIVGLSVWILHGFIEALLAACLTAIASWPLYAWCMARLPARMANRAGPVIFTCAITMFVLAPMAFAGSALLGEVHSLFLGIAAADGKVLGVSEWLANMPVVGLGFGRAGKASSHCRVD